MRWITGITLNNYRAFKGPYERIDIPANHHLLIYGENGSGKSSIYNALRDFFTSSMDNTKPFEVNLFSKVAKNEAGNIQLCVAELDEDRNIATSNYYTFGNPDAQSNHRIPMIQLASKVKGFLDYKRMLQTHFIDTPTGHNPNLFSLVVEDLLADHLIKKITGGVADVELQSEWKQIIEPIQKYDARYREHKYAVRKLPLFESALKELLIKIFTEFRRMVQQYFDPKLDIGITLSALKYKYPSIQKELFLKIKYAGEEIPSYQTFLNEARLSAIAISIYLAALKTYPPAVSDLKVLYLDDVFIGLDTNNRIPLLMLLKNEFIESGFQLFMSTYDRQWFEVARDWFDHNACKFKTQELYIEDDGNPLTPEYPIVLPSKGNIEKAVAYFKAKDYPATGNSLRKACEATIKNLLPDTYKITSSGDLVFELEGLLHQLNQLYEDSSIAKPQALLDALLIYRKVLLNPASHDDLKCHIYRREVEDAFTLLSQLQSLSKLDRKKVLDKGHKLSINFPADEYSMELALGDNLFLINHEGNKILSAAKYFIKKWTYKGIDYGKNDGGNIVQVPQAEVDRKAHEKRSLDEIFTGIKWSTGIAIPADLYSAVTIGTSGSLKDLLT